MDDGATVPSDQGAPAFQDFLAECILTLERDGADALEAMLASRPEFAARARARVHGLRAAGLLAEPMADPERIGPYRILQRLGAGGMGTVYLAQQQDELERRVALKVVKPGMDSREVLARFALERQALAMLDHQNIAKVLDAGQTEQGRPFLVMEYVSGMPITRYCDERRLSIPARIELFCLVCEAVQHAHHKGILHRDLKPSNILVADRDGRPWPMVIDFGVAKSLAGPLIDQSLVTVRGRLLGTPEYMSPEQAANELDVDTRTDVFSLGVVLYELLTGTLPIDSPRLRGASSDGLLRLLRDSDAPAPSRRLTAMGASAATAAGLRQTDGARLRRGLRGDLDWITLRALERDRNRRYGMPGELAADLQRHLRREPVLAGPPSPLYRWRKFLLRHRLPVASAAIVLVALVAGFATSLAAWQSAAASARQSDADFEHAVAAIERLVSFGDRRLAGEPQMDYVRRELLQDALHFYQAIAAGRSDGRRLDLRVALARARVGRLHYLLGEYTPALAAVDAALAELRGVPDDPRARASLPGIEHNRAQILIGLGRREEAVATLQAAIARFDVEPVEPRTRLLLFDQLARTLRLHDPQAALRALEQGMAVAAPWLGDEAPEGPTMPAAIGLAVRHATMLLDVGDPTAARRAAEAITPRVMALSSSADEPARQLFAEAAIELGAALHRLGAATRAVELLRRAVDVQRQLCADHPSLASAPRQLALVLNALADAQLAAGEPNAAATTTADACQVLEALVARAPVPSHRSLLGQVSINRARVLHAPIGIGSDIDTAPIRSALHRGIEVLDSLDGESRGAREVRLSLVLAWSLRSDLDQRAGAKEPAVADLQRAIDELRAVLAAAPSLAQVRRQLADRSLALARLLIETGSFAPALAVLDAVQPLGPAIEASTPGLAAGSYERWVAQLRALAHAGLGDVAAVLAAVQRPSAIERDWGGNLQQLEALALLLERSPPSAVRRHEVLATTRELLRRTLDFAGDMDPGMAGMVAVMTAQTELLRVRIERAAGDLAAATTAAEAAVAGYEPSFRARASDRNRQRLWQAAETWLQLLHERRQADELAAAIERLAGTFAEHGPELRRLATWCARRIALLESPDLVAAAQRRGIELLAASLARGGDVASLRTDEALAPLRPHPDFDALGARK